MEIIISILFFALSSAVCIQLFVKAHLLGAETIEQNKSIMWAQNLAELFTECEGNPDEIYHYLIASETITDENVEILERRNPGGVLCLFLNQDFVPCTKDSQNQTYIAMLSCRMDTEQTLQADVNILHTVKSSNSFAELPDSDASPVYSLHLTHHIASTLADMEVTADE